MSNFNSPKVLKTIFRAIFLSLIFFSQIGYCQLDMKGIPIRENTGNYSNFRIAAQTGTIPGFSMPFNTVRALSEINVVNKADAYPWMSSDGLRLYYSKQTVSSLSSIYYADRPNIESNFNTPQSIINGTITSHELVSCWLTNDELNIYFIADDIPNGNMTTTLFHSTRTSTSTNFSSLNVVTLTGSITGFIVGVSFTQDMSQLFVNDISNQSIESNLKFLKTSEDNYAFSKIVSKPQGYSPDPGQLSNDGLNFYFSLHDSLIVSPNNYFMAVAQRNNLTDDFSSFYYIDDTLINNYNKYNFVPYIVPDGSMMVFVRNPTNAWGKDDLYIAYNSTTSGIYLSSLSIVGPSFLQPGNTATFTGTVFPVVNTTNAGLNWSVNNMAIATIDGTGKMFAISQGVVTITGTAYTYTSTVTSSYIVTISNICPVATLSGIHTVCGNGSLSLALSLPQASGNSYSLSGSTDVTINQTFPITTPGWSGGISISFGNGYGVKNLTLISVNTCGTSNTLFTITVVNCSQAVTVTSTCVGCNTVPGTVLGISTTLGVNCTYSNISPSFEYQALKDTLYITSTSKGTIITHQWLVAGKAIDFAPFIKYPLDKSDLKRDSVDVRLIVMDLNGCRDTLKRTVSVFQVTKLTSEMDDEFIKLYPNPFDTFLELETNISGVLSIYNSLGQVIFNKAVLNFEIIDLNNLQSGIYYYKFTNERFVKNGKLTKE